MQHRFGLKIGDILLMVVISLAAIGMFLLPFGADEAVSAEIVIAETGEVRSVPLNMDRDYEIVVKDIKLTVRVQDAAVFVAQSTCRDGICHNTPPISRAGQSIVCAPAGVVVRITGKGAVVDGVSG